MKTSLALALVAVTVPFGASHLALAQAAGTGIANPPDAIVDDTPAPAPKPSAAIPALPAPTPSAAPAAEVYGPYQPLHPSATLRPRETAADDPDAGIVTEVPRHPNQVPVGTLLHIRLNRSIDTLVTPANTAFAATLDEQVENEGRVVLPAGSVVEGLITEVRGGRRVHGTALIHLETKSVLLPDGTRMPLRASVIDTDQFANMRTDEEGNILRKDHFKETLAVMTMTTGSAAAAGAVLGGGVGALVGAGLGAGLSTAVWLKQDRQAHLPEGATITLSLTDPLDIRPLVQEPGVSFVAPPSAAPAKDQVSMTAPVAAPAASFSAEPQSFVPAN